MKLLKVPIILQCILGLVSCLSFQPKSRLLNFFTGFAETSKHVLSGTVDSVKDYLQPLDPLYYPDDTVIRELLEYFKAKMKHPQSRLDLPMLDPFTADCLEGDIISDITGNISIHLQEVRIVGVSQFDIEKLKMNWTPITLDITLNFPHISANGSYNIGGMLGNIIPLHGNGPAELSVSNLNVTSKLFLGSLNKFIGMKSISLNYTVQEIKVNFTNIMGGGRFGDILNKVLSEEGPRILDLVRADLIQFCENWLNKHVNNVLAKLNITLTGVLDFVKVISTKKVNTILNYTPLRFEL